MKTTQPWEVDLEDLALYGRMLARITIAHLHPHDVRVNMLSQAAFYVSRRAVATWPQYQAWLRLMRRSPWFAETATELIVRRTLPDLQAQLAGTREANKPASDESELAQRVCVSTHEYWNRCLQIWVPLSMIWRIGGEAMAHYATHR